MIEHEESSPLLTTWVLFASPSEYRLFTTFHTTPSSGLGGQMQLKYRLKEKTEGTAAFESLLEKKLEKSAM